MHPCKSEIPQVLLSLAEERMDVFGSLSLSAAAMYSTEFLRSFLRCLVQNKLDLVVISYFLEAPLENVPMAV
jgi:hypothetical protein